MALRDYKSVLVGELAKYEANSRTHSVEQIEKIVRSITEFGFTNPLLNEVDFLEFNHKDGNGCQEFKENSASMIDKILTHGRTTEDLNILCRVCNALEYLERRNEGSAKRYTILWV